MLAAHSPAEIAMNTHDSSRQPRPDPAERDAFFPSPY